MVGPACGTTCGTMSGYDAAGLALVATAILVTITLGWIVRIVSAWWRERRVR